MNLDLNEGWGKWLFNNVICKNSNEDLAICLKLIWWNKLISLDLRTFHLVFYKSITYEISIDKSRRWANVQ